MAKKQVKKQVKKDGMAITGFTLGIVAFFFGWIPVIGQLIAIGAIIFGAIGISRTKNDVKPGRVLAIIGLVLGIVSLLYSVAIIFIAYFGVLNPSAFVP